jgi:small nuclear ribonucleoprotein (snRNP)-like protein
MEEITSLLQKTITVSTADGKNYTGTLSGVDSHSLTVCLTDAKDETGRLYHKLLLNGGKVSQIISSEKPFDLPALAARLERVFPPGAVKLNEAAGMIVVMEKIRLSEKGLVEGTGPTAERVQRVYEEFMRAQTRS